MCADVTLPWLRRPVPTQFSHVLTVPLPWLDGATWKHQPFCHGAACVHAGPVPGSTAHMRPQAPALPLQAQPVQTAQHLNGRPVSSPRPQPLQPMRQQAPAQQQVQATHQQPHMTGHTPPSRLPARKQYSPHVAAPGGNAPQQHAAEVGWEAATDEPRKLNGLQVPAHAESAPEWQAPATDWEAPPQPQQHAADWEWEPAKQTHAPQVQKHASRMPQKQAPDMGWEPAGQTQSVQAPAHAGNMPRQHAPNAEWDAPPQEHHRQPAKQTYSPQVPPHVPGRPGSAGGVPSRRLNGQPVKMPVRQLPNGTHQQNGFPAQQSHANQGAPSVTLLRVAETFLARAGRTMYLAMMCIKLEGLGMWLLVGLQGSRTCMAQQILPF